MEAKATTLQSDIETLRLALAGANAHVEQAEEIVRERTDLLDRARKWAEALAAERDEMHAHASRLDRELRNAELQLTGAWKKLLDCESDLAARNADLLGCREETAVLTFQRGRLMIERDEMQGHAERLKHERSEAMVRLAALENITRRLWVEPGHYYSPIVDTESPFVLWHFDERRFELPCYGIQIDEAEMLGLVQRLARCVSGLALPISRQEGARYFLENGKFSYGDSLNYAGMLCEFNPHRVIEVGAGFSTCLCLDVMERVLGGSTELTVIEPYPQEAIRLLRPGDQHKIRILDSPLQAIPTSVFEELGRNDILFIDSSHVAKSGSDVLDYAFRILPALRDGVLIHIHDIFYPFEYPPEWVIGEGRSWNEAYLVRGLLQRNDDLQVIFFNDLIYNNYRSHAA